MYNAEWEEKYLHVSLLTRTDISPWNFFNLVSLQNLKGLSVIFQCLKCNEVVHKAV